MNARNESSFPHTNYTLHCITERVCTKESVGENDFPFSFRARREKKYAEDESSLFTERLIIIIICPEWLTPLTPSPRMFVFIAHTIS